ncbi:hypothetical protein ABZP36_025868 [Zizania latifolia]
MVVLVESPGGLTLKRKGVEEAELFLCPGDGDEGFPLACRATKIRRLVRDDDGLHGEPAATADDVAMGEAASTADAPEDDGAMVVYETVDAAAGSIGLLCQWWLLRPWATLSTGAGAEWIREMLREADSRTVRQLLGSVHEEGAGMALVPWGSAPAPAATGASIAEGSAAMEVEEEGGNLAQTLCGASTGCGEGYMCRPWPQHCMPPSHLPAISQASSVMWSW